jgi:hypothetical protein
VSELCFFVSLASNRITNMYKIVENSSMNFHESLHEEHTIAPQYCMEIYSAYNHKRATAAKCRESHRHRTDATTAVPFPDSGGVTHGILQRWRAYDCTHCTYTLKNSVASVHKRTIPTERPPLVSEVSANFFFG